MGFILQLSNFMKEWHFHLPQLMRDVQVNLGYLCQACTSLLHSRKMLQHYLQVLSACLLWLLGIPHPGFSVLRLFLVSPPEQKWRWYPLSYCPPSSAATHSCPCDPLLLFLV